jgi:hypothetical protein
MRPDLSRVIGVLVAALWVFAAGTGVASAGTPIQPDQHFLGFVNGSRATPVVYTVCPGPQRQVAPGRWPAGRACRWAHVRSGGGYTGPLSQVYAWFVPNAAVNGRLPVSFTTYGTERAIPAGVRVPCDGKGRVEFSACPYLAPCVAGWIPNYVKVEFVNIAA